MALIDWIPKFIAQTLNRPPRHKVTNLEWNELFNLLIEQGDHNTNAIVNLRNELQVRPTFTELEAVYATKAEVQGLIIGEFPEGSIPASSLAFDPVTQDELAAALAAFEGSGSGVVLKAEDMTGGTLAADSMAQFLQSRSAESSTSVVVPLASIATDKLPMGVLSVILRLRSSFNSTATDLVRVTISKWNGTTWTSHTVRTFKANVFPNTTDYANLYVGFEYAGGLALDNNIQIKVDLLAHATAATVRVDTITVLPSTIGIVDA